MRVGSLLACALLLVGACGAAAQLELHGSGTTNPSKFFWKVMDILEERTSTPVTMTYRAVGEGKTPGGGSLSSAPSILCARLPVAPVRSPLL